MSDPFAWHRVGSNKAVKFYGYGEYLPRQEVTQVLRTATSEGLTHLGELPVGSEPLQSWEDNVRLILIPREGMTWRAWSTALWGMRMTVQDKEMYFEWSFSVIQRVTGQEESGTLTLGTKPLVESSRL